MDVTQSSMPSNIPSSWSQSESCFHLICGRQSKIRRPTEIGTSRFSPKLFSFLFSSLLFFFLGLAISFILFLSVVVGSFLDVLSAWICWLEFLRSSGREDIVGATLIFLGWWTLSRWELYSFVSRLFLLPLFLTCLCARRRFKRLLSVVFVSQFVGRRYGDNLWLTLP